MSTIDRTLRAIEHTRNRGLRDLLIGHFSVSPITFPMIPAPSHSLHLHIRCTSSLITHHHSRPPPATVNRHNPLPLTPTAPHFQFSLPHTITSPPLPPQPFTFFFLFFFLFSILTNCNLLQQIVVVFCVVLLVFCRGLDIFFGIVVLHLDCKPPTNCLIKVLNRTHNASDHCFHFSSFKFPCPILPTHF